MDSLVCRKKQQSLIILFEHTRLKCIRDFQHKETFYNFRGNDVNFCILKFNHKFMKISFTYNYEMSFQKSRW